MAINKFKVLVKNNVVFSGGLLNEKEDEIIEFENMRVETTAEDPDKVVLVSREEIIKLISAIQDTVFDLKYTFEFNPDDFTFAGPIPSATELEALYSGTGIPANDTSGIDVLLKRDGTGDAVLTEGDGITVINLETGVYEVAGYQAAKILIDTSKNELPNILADLEARIVVNENDIETLETEQTTQRAEIDELNGRIIVTNGGEDTADNTPLTTKLVGEDKYTSEQNTQDNNIASNTAAINTNATNISTNTTDIATINSGQITQNNRLEAIEGDLTLVEQISDQVLVFPNNGILDLSTLVDIDGNAITLTNGEEFEISLRHTVRNEGSSGKLIVGNITGHVFVLPSGNSSDSIKLILNNTTQAIGNVTNGSDDIEDFEIWRVVKKIRIGSSVGLASTTGLAAVKKTADEAELKADTNTAYIAALNVALRDKQDKTDNALQTSTKSIVGAINENKAKIDSDNSDINNLNTKVVDGTTLLQDIKSGGDVSGETLREALGLYGINIAIGNDAGKTNQGTPSVAIGNDAGKTNQGDSAVAIGNAGGSFEQGDSAVAIGDGAGGIKQGSFSTAMGSGAGDTNQHSKSIAINANDTPLDTTSENQILMTAGTTTVEVDTNGLKVNGDKINGFAYAKVLESGKTYEVISSGDGEYTLQIWAGPKWDYISMVNNKAAFDTSLTNTSGLDIELGTAINGNLLVNIDFGDAKAVVINGEQLDSWDMVETTETITTPIEVPVINTNIEKRITTGKVSDHYEEIRNAIISGKNVTFVDINPIGNVGPVTYGAGEVFLRAGSIDQVPLSVTSYISIRGA